MTCQRVPDTDLRPSLAWVDGPASSACAVCESPASRLLAHVHAARPPGVPPLEVDVERCTDCGSLRLVGSEHEYPSTDEGIDDHLEAGAGIEAIANAIAQAGHGTVRRFLDIGCYYGFGVHLAEQLFGWEAIGVEPSLAGERGRKELGVDIRAGLLGEVGDIGRFDLILASEVLEHVNEPVDLLCRIRDLLADGGRLVLTTPAAEVVAPGNVEMLQALSPGDHRFLASAEGLRILLGKAGFRHHEVTRRGATLHAVASVTALEPIRRVQVDLRDLVAYYDRAADAAPPGTALAAGMSARHFRTAAMIGDFATAEKSFPRARDSLFALRGFDLDDPETCIAQLRGGGRPPWSLAGSAYSAGMLALVGRSDPANAAAYFELGAEAAESWTRVNGVLEIDLWNLRQQSLGHHCISLARCDPERSVRAAERLSEVLDPAIAADADRLVWWNTRLFNELVAAGHLDVATELLPAVEQSVEMLAGSTDLEYRRTGLDALFLLGIRALNTGAPTLARAWFAYCAASCEAIPGTDGYARLAADARAHDALAAAQGGVSPIMPARSVGDPRVVLQIDTYWCDASGFYLRGFAHAGDLLIERVTLHNGSRSAGQRPSAREDVTDIYGAAGLTVPPHCGFALYVEGRPGDDVRVELEGASESLSTSVQLPDHPVPLFETPSANRDLELTGRLLSHAGPGPILLLGWRVPPGTDLAEFEVLFGDRKVVNVDIHPGENVDVVGDVHQLSRFFRPGAFAAAMSASLLEHLAAPWLVAAELNRVLAPGAPMLHVAPTTWPEHAQPNDFWRFTAEGLALLFGPATGFEVLEKEAFAFTRIHPEPDWRAGFLDMPTVPASSSCWVLARKTGEIPPGTIEWPYDPALGEQTAKAYPVEAVVGRVQES